ncbi:hypothetical protein Tco_1520217 [Tanacetum coccineum]
MVPIQEYLKEGILPKDPQKARSPTNSAGECKVLNGSHRLLHKMGRSKTINIYDRQTYGKIHMGTYKAVIPIEIRVKTKRVQDFDSKENEKRRREDLDILEERREMEAIKEAHYKQKLEGYYNKNVKPSTFKPGTYVL